MTQTKPNDFSSSTKAKASEVNANFDTLYDTLGLKDYDAEHKQGGQHKDVTATGLTVSGTSTFQDTVTVDGTDLEVDEGKLKLIRSANSGTLPQIEFENFDGARGNPPSGSVLIHSEKDDELYRRTSGGNKDVFMRKNTQAAVAKAQQQSNQKVANANTWYKINFDTELLDTKNGQSTSTWSYTVQTGDAGIFMLSYQIKMSENAIGAADEDFKVRILKNGSELSDQERGREESIHSIDGNNSTYNVPIIQYTTVLNLSDGDKLELEFSHSDGGADPIIVGSSTIGKSMVWIARLGGA